MHLFQTTVLVRQLFDFADTSNLHATAFCFPIEVGRVGYRVLAADFLHLAAAFNLFQHSKNLCFFEKDFKIVMSSAW